MQIIRDLAALRPALDGYGGQRVALVPTMGALHAGHIALVTAARRQADKVVATIFVNPLQFGAGEDLDRYPRREEADAAMLAEAHCDLLWIPSGTDLYPPGFATSISVAGISERWEGAARPGHFDGVATVVAKLLIAVRPNLALFGEKDAQQLAVIRQMVIDLGLPIEIGGVATVRDPDGLALSSRNVYLSDDERRRAVNLPQALHQARDAILAGGSVSDALVSARERLTGAGFGPIDYLALVDGATLEPLEAASADARLIVAARIGPARLIDNLAL